MTATTDLPAPLVPPEATITGLKSFMLNVDRLFASELWAMSSGEEFKAAMALWGRAWQQTPAGSLPNDERLLAAFSGTGKGVEGGSTPRQEATEPAQNMTEIITEAQFTFPPYVEPTPTPQPAQGAYRIHELGFEQCRFACNDADKAGHRFCGAPAPIGPGNLHGSWCAEHRALVFGGGTLAQRRAGEIDRRVRMA